MQIVAPGVRARMTPWSAGHCWAFPATNSDRCPRPARRSSPRHAVLEVIGPRRLRGRSGGEGVEVGIGGRVAGRVAAGDLVEVVTIGRKRGDADGVVGDQLAEIGGSAQQHRLAVLHQRISGLGGGPSDGGIAKAGGGRDLADDGGRGVNGCGGDDVAAVRGVEVTGRDGVPGARLPVDCAAALVATSVRNPRNRPGRVVSLRVTVTRLVLELVEKVAWAWPAPARSESPTSTVIWAGIE